MFNKFGEWCDFCHVLEESRRKAHTACDFAHFFCCHVVDFVEVFVDSCCYEVFEHFEVFCVDHVAVEVDGLDLFFAVDDDFDGAAACGIVGVVFKDAAALRSSLKDAGVRIR